MISGYQDLKGQTIGTLFVIQRAGLAPLKWLCRCSVCKTEQIVTHTRLQSGAACGNSHIRVEPASSSGSTGVIPTAVRSRDAEEAARYTREQEQHAQLSPETEKVIEVIGTFASGARGL